MEPGKPLANYFRSDGGSLDLGALGGDRKLLARSTVRPASSAIGTLIHVLAMSRNIVAVITDYDSARRQAMYCTGLVLYCIQRNRSMTIRPHLNKRYHDCAVTRFSRISTP